MEKPYLVKAQSELSLAKKEFLDAMDLYVEDGTDDGAIITQRFLVKNFLSPESSRSCNAQKKADEAIRLIKRFGAIRSSLAFDIAILLTSMKSVVLQFIPDYVEALNEEINRDRPECTDPKSSVEDVGWASTTLETARKVAEKYPAEAIKYTAKIGEHQASIVRMATKLLLMRKATLRQFRKEKVQVSWTYWREQLAKEVKDAAKKELAKGAWKGVVAAVAALTTLPTVGIYGPPLFTLGWLLWKLGGVFPGQEIRGYGKRSDQDELDDLLIALRSENEIFEELKKVFAIAVDELEKTRSPFPLKT